MAWCSVNCSVSCPIHVSIKGTTIILCGVLVGTLTRWVCRATMHGICISPWWISSAAENSSAKSALSFRYLVSKSVQSLTEVMTLLKSWLTPCSCTERGFVTCRTFMRTISATGNAESCKELRKSADQTSSLVTSPKLNSPMDSITAGSNSQNIITAVCFSTQWVSQCFCTCSEHLLTVLSNISPEVSDSLLKIDEKTVIWCIAVIAAQIWGL